MPKAKQ